MLNPENDSKVSLKVPVEVIPNNYDKILKTTKFRNKNRFKSAEKNNLKTDLEQGFSLYFNGANNNSCNSKVIHNSSSRRIQTSAGFKPQRKTWNSLAKPGSKTDRCFNESEYDYSEDFEDDFDSISEEIDFSKSNTIKVDMSINELKVLRASLADHSFDIFNSQESNLFNDCDNKRIIRLEMDNISEISSENCNTNDNNDDHIKNILRRIMKMNEIGQEKLLKSLENMEEKCHNFNVTLELLNNWGNKSKIGLTEIEFLDSNNRSLPISNIKCSNNINNVDVLINGKRDTINSRNMWLCDIIESNIKLHIDIICENISDIYKINVWNYNRDPLNAGVKTMRLMYQNDLLKEIIVDRALGKRGINPPTVIIISDNNNDENNSDINDDKEKIDDDENDDECLMEQLLGKNSARRGEIELKQALEDLEKSNCNGNKSQITIKDSFDEFLDEIQNEQFNIDTNSGQNDNKTNEFVIPSLPTGSTLTIDIFTTWGDPHYVGLTGIELFSANGSRIHVSHIWADPPNINILPGYGNDPRVVTNLLDGVNRTTDDIHMWLAPFTKGKRHRLQLENLTEDLQNNFHEIKLAVMRIWNYNKSRIHSSRGAKDVEISLDGKMIFCGEICQADGENDGGGGEVILFTDDDEILDRVGMVDDEFVTEVHEEEVDEEAVTKELLDSLTLRPPTARQFEISEDYTIREESPVSSQIERPFTCTMKKKPASIKISHEQQSVCVKLDFVDTWINNVEISKISQNQKTEFIGLCGLQFLDEAGDILETSVAIKELDISDDNDDDNEDFVDFDADVLLDGENVTSDPNHMFLITRKQLDRISLQFLVKSSIQNIRTLRVWNYNSAEEDTRKGVRHMHVWFDEKCVSPEDCGFLLRRGPGHILYDYRQDLDLQSNNKNILQEEDIEGHTLPWGFVFQFNLYSSWDDLYYIGLNGIELYDHQGLKIHVHPDQVFACPESVNALIPKRKQNVEWSGLTLPTSLDIRTPDKLVDGHNNGYDPKHMWLAPILPGWTLNRVFIVLSKPISISMVRIWNYSKTPSRGVKEFALLVDDLLVYSGILPAAPLQTNSRGILPGMSDSIVPINSHRTILFDRTNEALLASEKGHILTNSDFQQPDVILINVANENSRQSLSTNQNSESSEANRPVTSVLKERTRISKLR